MEQCIRLERFSDLHYHYYFTEMMTDSFIVLSVILHIIRGSHSVLGKKNVYQGCRKMIAGSVDQDLHSSYSTVIAKFITITLK